MTEEVEKLCKRFERAHKRRAVHNRDIDDAYEFSIPLRDKPLVEGTVTETNSHAVSRRVFDSTAMDAVAEAADQLHGAVTPQHEQFLDVDGVPGTTVDEETLAEAKEAFFDHLQASNFHTEINICYQQAQIATATLAFYENQDRYFNQSAFHFEAVPLSEIFPEPYIVGQKRSVWRLRRMAPSSIVQAWPQVELTDSLQKKLDEKPDEPIEILEASLYDVEQDQWRYMIIEKGDKDILWEQNQATSQFITFGVNRAQNVDLHYGPVMLALPDIRTLNEAVRLVLENADMAASGMYQVDDDGTIDTDNIVIGPRVVLVKATGSAGLQRIEMAGNFDISQIVIDDMRNRVTETIRGPQLPPIDKPSVTATHVERAVEEMQLIRMPRFLRVFSELVLPLFDRATDILSRRGLVERIESTEATITASSSIMNMQGVGNVSRALGAYQMVAERMPDAVAVACDQDALAAWCLEEAGVPAAVEVRGEEVRILLDGDERAAARQAMSQRQQMAEGAEMVGRGGPGLKAIGEAING